MRLADDRRARVPFALIGVLLLVGSATYATTLTTGGPHRYDDAVDTAMDRTEASISPALRSAVKTAARDAARDPVTVAADTPAGQVLNASTPFRDALRLRIYLAARERLEATHYRNADVVASASLPAVSELRDLSAAKRRVIVERATNGTALTVTVRNVTTTARRDGSVVAHDTETVTLTVSTPVLLVHERTSRYERRLSRGPLDGPGLGRRLTAGLAPIVWARSAGQYAGMPIANVLGNRHVELAANGGTLATQRAVFGHDDPRARRGLQQATVAVGVQDLHAGTESTLRSRLERTYPPTPVSLTGTGAPPALAEAGPSPNRTLSVGVNRTADVAFVGLVSGGRPRPQSSEFDRVLRASYRAEARLVTDVERTLAEDEPRRRPPGENWSLVDERERERNDVDDAGTSERWDVGDEQFTSFARRVTRHNRVVRVWRRGNETRRRVHHWEERYHVRVAVVGEYAPRASAPTRPVRPRFERGGALDGPNLRGVPSTATDRLLTTNRDTVAVRAVDGDTGDTSTVVYGARPDELSTWVARDVAHLRSHVRNVSVDVEARAVATGQVNPPALLAERLRERRAALVDAPTTYDGVADRARVAARAAYLDRVVTRLEERAATQEESTDVLDEALSKADVGSTDRLAAALSASDRSTDPAYRDVGVGDRSDGVALVPDGSPGYLTLSAVSNDHVEAVPDGRRYRPLTARNVNVFAVPYGDATDGVLSLFQSNPQVDLRTAGSTLVAANRTLEQASNESLRARRDTLRRSVGRSLSVVEKRVRRPVTQETSLTKRAYRAAVDAAFSRWDGAGHRALAVTNGSFARALTAEVRARDDLTARDADRLGARLRVAVGRAAQREAASVPRKEVNGTSQAIRAYAHSTVKSYVAAGAESVAERGGERAARRVLDETVDGVPAGLPVAPVPGYWYATVNVWSVSVRGEYLRFTVRAYSDHADGSGTTLQYVRDGSPVTLDVDGDGEAERLGRSERISFETQAVAVTAVPGGRWVGDVDGDADERSTGWKSGPGCVARKSSEAGAAAKCRAT
ncbi:DUF7286 family protein [Halogranum rubrum]|uniref:DUF7286 family protein n=1 Tax=Halogranum rubrum TaxID=553466 RepID=UPI0012F9644E|nr:hypothetical protein [Halogranum salarium]